MFSLVGTRVLGHFGPYRYRDHRSVRCLASTAEFWDKQVALQNKNENVITSKRQESVMAVPATNNKVNFMSV